MFRREVMRCDLLENYVEDPRIEEKIDSEKNNIMIKTLSQLVNWLTRPDNEVNHPDIANR